MNGVLSQGPKVCAVRCEHDKMRFGEGRITEIRTYSFSAENQESVKAPFVGA